MEQQRREMARLERRAIAAYERDLLVELRELALVEAGCRSIDSQSHGLGSMQLFLHDRVLSLLGVTASACRTVTALPGEVRVVAAGRYDSRWWVTLSNGAGAITVLAQRLHSRPLHGGLGVAELVA